MRGTLSGYLALLDTFHGRTLPPQKDAPYAVNLSLRLRLELQLQIHHLTQVLFR